MNTPWLRNYWSTVKWSLRLAWQTSPRHLSGLGVATLAGGILPAAAALTARGLIDATLPELSADKPSLAPVVPWLIAGTIIAIFEATLHLVREYLNKRLVDDLNLEVTGRVLTHAAELDVAYFERSGSQDLLQRAQDRAAERFATFIKSLFLMVTSLVQVASLAAILVLLEPLTLAAILFLALPYLIFQSRLATTAYEIERARATKRRWTTYFVQQLTLQPAVSEVKVLRLGPLLVDKFRALMTEFRNEDRRLYKQSFAGSALFATTATVIFYALMVRVVVRAIGGSATLGDVAIYAGATARLRGAVQDGVVAFNGLKENSLHNATLRRFLEEEAQIRSGTGLHPTRVKGALRLDNVHFRYPDAVEASLSGVNLEIEAGETLALVGENGSGKSTIVKLLARLYDPSEGRILLDDCDLREYDLDFLHAQFGFVFQHFTRYEASVADNIAYGDWRKLLRDRERVEAIARLAGTHDLITTMPDGYDTPLGPKFGAHDISGGQWQRIAVARAFAREASLLILDEPTASLDVRSEAELFKRFRELAHGRTTILISHRFSTVALADRIAVLERGRIVECGSHDELIALGGLYAELHSLHRRDAI